MNYSSKYLEPILKVSSRIKICGLTRPEDIAIANEILPDYIGYEIPDEFVIGYGLDFAGKYRNLNYVGIYSE